MPDQTPAPTPTPEAPSQVEAPQPAASEVITPPRDGSPLATAGAGTQPESEGAPAPEGEEKPEGEEPPEGEGVTALTADDIKKSIELPEGVSADDELLGKFADYAAEAGLTAEQSKNLAAMYFEAQEGLIQQLAQANQKGWDTTIDKWKAEIDADPVIGNGNQEAVQTVLGKALDEYGSPEARQAFELTGAGWNPAIIRMIHKMAQVLTEGGPVVALAPARPRPKTLGQALYPDGGQGIQQPAS